MAPSPLVGWQSWIIVHSPNTIIYPNCLLLPLCVVPTADGEETHEPPQHSMSFDVEFEKAEDALEERQKNRQKYSFSTVNVGTIAASQPAHKRMKPDQLPQSPCTIYIYMPTVAQSFHAQAQKYHTQQVFWKATHCAKCLQHNTKCICDIREHLLL